MSPVAQDRNLSPNGGQENMRLMRQKNFGSRLTIQLPAPLRRKLVALCEQGYTMAGYIRAVLEKELNQVQVMHQKGR